MQIVSQILFVIVLLVSAIPALASMDKARKAMDVEDFATAFKLLESMEKNGDPEAQLLLGQLRYGGKGSFEDKLEGFKSIKRAADQGYAKAQSMVGFMLIEGSVRLDPGLGADYAAKAVEQKEPLAFVALGSAYLKGRGRPKDTNKGIQLIREGAELGDEIGQSLMATFYHKGEGVPKNLERAAYWYKKSADQHDYLSQMWLANFYSDGIGVSVDPIKALMWGTLAIAQKGKAWVFDPGHSILQKIIKKHKLSAENIFEAHKLAKAWVKKKNKLRRYTKGTREFLKQAEAGDPNFQFKLGLRYLNGERVLPDFVRAYKWISMAAAQGHTRSEMYLGGLYSNGLGVPKDYEVAIKWFMTAGKKGKTAAFGNIGAIYVHKDYTRKDDVEALKWLNLGTVSAIGFGVSPHQKLKDNLFKKLSLRQILKAQKLSTNWFSINLPKYHREATAKYLEKAKADDVLAQYKLGEIYLHGITVPQDFVISRNWLTKAAENGSEAAMMSLARLYYTGTGVKKDLGGAITWARKAIKLNQHFPDAHYFMADRYRNGEGVEQNYQRAFDLYRSAANAGLMAAQIAVSSMYINGKGVDQNFEKAFTWCELAMTRGGPTQLYKAAKGICNFLRGRLTREVIKQGQRQVVQLRKQLKKVDRSWTKRGFSGHWLRTFGNGTMQLNPKTTFVYEEDSENPGKFRFVPAEESKSFQ